MMKMEGLGVSGGKGMACRKGGRGCHLSVSVVDGSSMVRSLGRRSISKKLCEPTFRGLAPESWGGEILVSLLRSVALSMAAGQEEKSRWREGIVVCLMRSAIWIDVRRGV